MFISHAAADRALADAFVQFLRLGGSLRRDEVLCTSLEGTNVPWGADFVEEVRRELADARLVIQLITPVFLESSFCLCELGAQWAMGLTQKPSAASLRYAAHMADRALAERSKRTAIAITA